MRGAHSERSEPASRTSETTGEGTISVANVNVLRGIAVALLAVLATGCSSGSATKADAPSAPASSSQSPAAESATADAGESVDCQLAAAKWADRINKHATDAIMGTAVIATTLDIDNLDDMTSEIKVLCSEDLANDVLEANYEIAKVNAYLRVCELSDNVCSRADSKKILRSTDKIGRLVSEVSAKLQE